jgi:hypothetical protein
MKAFRRVSPPPDGRPGSFSAQDAIAARLMHLYVQYHNCDKVGFPHIVDNVL